MQEDTPFAGADGLANNDVRSLKKVADAKRTLAVAPMLDWTDRHYRYMARLISKHTWLYLSLIHI